MSRGVQHLELERACAIGLTFDECRDVVQARREWTELFTQRLPFLDDVLFGLVDRDRDGPERLPQLMQSSDVVDVGVGQQDGFHVRAAGFRSFEDQLGFEVGVDHHSVVRLVIVDEVGVGAEASVGGDLDVHRHG